MGKCFCISLFGNLFEGTRMTRMLRKKALTRIFQAVLLRLSEAIPLLRGARRGGRGGLFALKWNADDADAAHIYFVGETCVSKISLIKFNASS